MLKKIMMASLAAGALALNALVASAAPTTFDCNFNAVAQETATGGQDTFTGEAWGYVVGSSADAAVSITCFVKVDGVAASSTPTGSGTGAAVTAGQVTYVAPDGSDVKLCYTWTEGSASSSDCFETTRTQIPPDEVIDAIDTVFDTFADLTAPTDPLVCLGLVSAGTPAAINSTTATTGFSQDADDCDLYQDGERVIDFVPYED